MNSTMRFSVTRNNASAQNILYELMLFTEWNQETDNLRSFSKTIDKPKSARLWKPWEYLKKCESLLDEITILQNSSLAWNFAIGEGETVLALLQDSLLEIRTPRDDFCSVIGKATVGRDSSPSWRRLCWSPDCGLLALGASSGAVSFYDLLASNLFNIPPPSNNKEPHSWNPEMSLAGMFFMPSRTTNQKWPYELILVDYTGHLRSYYVSPTDGFMEFHRFSFSKGGVSCMCWDATHNLIIVSSTPDHNNLDLKRDALAWGLSAWRLLNDHPYYRVTSPSPEDMAKAEARRGLTSSFPSFYSSPTFSVVFKMVASPDSQHLACLHTCGTVSIWLLPSLRLHGVWSLKEQPNFDYQPEKSNKGKGYHLQDFFPADISWWAEQKVIIGRRNGALSVCELSELRNLLGETPEHVQGDLRLSAATPNKGVLILECEVDNQDESSGGDEAESLVHKSSLLLRSTVYLITDMERFQPKRRRAKIQTRIYRLLGIKSTTPEELFSRKIDFGEFDEALNLAKAYGLDCDRVYQSQWRNSPVTKETISAYLSKISKKRWVFEECHERVPDNLAAAKKLIEFGLEITSLEALANLTPEVDEESFHDAEAESGESEVMEKLLTIAADDLSDDQKCLILTRRTLLRFSDKLFTYEKMISSSEEKYKRELYDKFRRQPVSVSIVEFARQSDSRAVELLLTYQGREALPHWLTSLSNFPETTSPESYKALLPECSPEGAIFPWAQKEIRKEDWCENKHFDVLEPAEDLSEYALPQTDGPLSRAAVEEWYRNRAYELEQLSSLVDQPLSLVRLARQRYIKGLDGLYNELVTLDVLVYDVGLEDLSLRDLEIMSPQQKAEALMTQTSEDNFVQHLRHHLVPYLQRCETLQALSRSHLLSQYISQISARDLTRPLKMFEYCTAEPFNSLVQNSEELVNLALDAIYSHEGSDQLDKADAILKTLRSSTLELNGSVLMDKVNAAENELTVAMILKCRGRPLSPFYLHKQRQDVETARGLLRELCTLVTCRVPPAGEADWTQLLQDLLQVQALVFTCVPIELCYEVYTTGVLASGNSAVIRTAVRSLCSHSEEQQRKPLSLQRSVALVLQAATQYFDSAASLTDPSLQLAKACLILITEDNNEIQEEKDLIAALHTLHEFKISLLPMQVRLCTDRMKLIESCLASKPTAYKDYHKLLSLAHKLRICGNDSRQREGMILIRVANIAFEAHDYQYAVEVCEQLMARRHAVGWQVAQQLGQCPHFWDLQTRQKLIAFALVHCPDNKVQDLLETRCELEHKKLQLFIQSQTSTADSPLEEEEFMDAVTSPQSPVKQFPPAAKFDLTSTIQNTSRLLAQLTNSGFWKQKLLDKDSGGVRDTTRKGETKMTEQGFLEFYRSLHPRIHASVLSPDYGVGEREGSVVWPQFHLLQALLHTALLEQEKLPPHLIRDMDSVLVQYALILMPEDSCVGLAALLALTSPALSDQVFSCLPLTLLTLQLAVYLLALLLALPHHPQAFLWTPDQVLAWAVKQADGSTQNSQLLNKALTQLKNFEESKQVERLNLGVNVRRFAWDHQYKIDSILGLAMCEEWERLAAALELGEAHGVAAWEITLSHLHSLLCSNSPLLTERLADNRLTQLLQNNADSVINRLQEVVLPTLSGLNHNQLISYFSVVQAVAPHTEVLGLPPRDHVKLIKKVKATSSDIDYLRLVTQPSEVLDVLRPALRRDSVFIVAKLLKELLKALPSLQTHITVSSLYADWVITQFKTECLGQSSVKPVNQFGSLLPHLQKMSSADVLSFVKRALCCHQSVVHLDLDTRLAMLDSVLRLCQQQPNWKDNPDCQKIIDLKQYIENVWALENAHSKSLRIYLMRLDEACGDPEAVSTVIMTALTDASVPSPVLQKMAKLLNRKSLSGYVTDVLHSLPSQPSMVTTILQRVEDCLAHREKGESWSILIGPLTERADLPASVHKLAAQISQRLGDNYASELEALRLRTEAVLRSSVSVGQVGDQNSRYLLFKERLSEAETWTELHTLSLLLSAWPDVDTSWYLELIEMMADVPSEEKFRTLQLMFKKIRFEEEEISHLVDRLGATDDELIISVCIISGFKALHSRAVLLLRKLPKGTKLPKELARRVVEVGVTVQLVGSPAFDWLQATLLEGGPAELCQRASQELSAADHPVEADMLLQAISS